MSRIGRSCNWNGKIHSTSLVAGFVNVLNFHAMIVPLRTWDGMKQPDEKWELGIWWKLDRDVQGLDQRWMLPKLWFKTKHWRAIDRNKREKQQIAICDEDLGCKWTSTFWRTQLKEKTPARQLVSIPEDSIEKRDDLEHILNKYWKMGLFQKTTTFPVLVYFPTTTQGFRPTLFLGHLGNGRSKWSWVRGLFESHILQLLHIGCLLFHKARNFIQFY